MPIQRLKVSRYALGTMIGIACLFVGDNAAVTPELHLITPASARVTHPVTASSHTRVARHAKRAVVSRAAIPFDFGYSAGSSAYYGYTPGAYGGTGCYRGAYGLVCP